MAAPISTAERRAKDAERKREARAHAKEQSPKDPRNFGPWLCAHVIGLPRLKSAWSDELGAVMGEGVEYDRLLRRYAAGEVTPKTDTAYRIGEGLRALEHPWVCGIVAVHAAGHLSAYYGFVLSLLGRFPIMRNVSMTLLRQVPRVNRGFFRAEESTPINSGMPESLRNELTSNADRFDKEWHSWNPAQRLDSVPDRFRLVVEIARQKTLPLAEREEIIEQLVRPRSNVGEAYGVVLPPPKKEKAP